MGHLDLWTAGDCSALYFFFSSILLSLLSSCAVLPNIDSLLSALRRLAPALLLFQELEGTARPPFSFSN